MVGIISKRAKIAPGVFQGTRAAGHWADFSWRDIPIK
jgi:hypothetical protein